MSVFPELYVIQQETEMPEPKPVWFWHRLQHDRHISAEIETPPYKEPPIVRELACRPRRVQTMLVRAHAHTHTHAHAHQEGPLNLAEKLISVCRRRQIDIDRQVDR